AGVCGRTTRDDRSYPLVSLTRAAQKTPPGVSRSGRGVGHRKVRPWGRRKSSITPNGKGRLNRSPPAGDLGPVRDAIRRNARLIAAPLKGLLTGGFHKCLVTRNPC